MTVIIVSLVMIFVFAVLGFVGYASVHFLKNNAEVQSHGEMIKNLSNAAFVLGMLTFMFVIFYAPVAYPQNKDNMKITEGNVKLSDEQFKYQKKYPLENFVLKNVSGSVTYRDGLKRDKDNIFVFENYPKDASGAVSLKYNEIWVNDHNDIYVYWDDKKFVAEIGYQGQYKDPAATNISWVMDRYAFLKMKEEKFE